MEVLGSRVIVRVADLDRSGHSQDPQSAKTLNHVARNICLSIDGGGIQVFVQKAANVLYRPPDFILLLGRNLGIRHDPISNETPQKKSFGHAEFLRSSEQQLLSLTNLLFPERIDLGFSLTH